jgi:hypothetical protein
MAAASLFPGGPSSRSPSFRSIRRARHPCYQTHYRLYQTPCRFYRAHYPLYPLHYLYYLTRHRFYGTRRTRRRQINRCITAPLVGRPFSRRILKFTRVFQRQTARPPIPAVPRGMLPSVGFPNSPRASTRKMLLCWAVPVKTTS